MAASMESKQTYYILHMSYTNCNMSIVLPYIHPPTSIDDSGVATQVVHWLEPGLE